MLNFTRQEIALAYANSAEYVCLGVRDANGEIASNEFLPIIVNLLYQSLEISIKHVGIKSGLITEGEARSRKTRSGHDIEELALLVDGRLGCANSSPIVRALTYQSKVNKSIINEMVFGGKMAKTREKYAKRCLGYAEVSDGDFATIGPIKNWVEALKEVAENLPVALNIINQWKNSDSQSTCLAIWPTIEGKNNKCEKIL